MAALRTIMWVGLLLALVAPLYAQDVEPSMSDQVKAWARRLDSDTLEDRERAERQIIELGHKALEYLPEVKPSTAAETKARLQRIRTVLEKKRADSAAKASRITLSVKDKPLADVLGAIQEQTENKLVDYRSNFGQRADGTKVSVDWEDVPFWEIFRFEPTRVESFLNLSDRSQRGTFLNLQVAWEPRVEPIVIKLPLDQLTVEDEEGNSLQSGDRTGSLDTEVVQGVSAVDIQLPLGSTDRSSQKIATLKGEMVALMPGRMETFTFDKLETARNVKDTRGAIEVVLETFRPNGDIWEASIMLR
ncbi:unnamed protein product, partial [Symbiodinium sp. CCMP2456]